MIVVYTKENCPYCVKSKALLKGYGLEYIETMIGKDITREEFLDKFPEARTVPQIVMDDELVGGFEELAKRLAK
jgi:glutaredoxin